MCVVCIENSMGGFLGFFIWIVVGVMGIWINGVRCAVCGDSPLLMEREVIR